MSKPCSTCHTRKPLAEFHKNATAKDGLSTSCKVCASARSAKWNAIHRDERYDYMRKYREIHPEQIRQYLRNWRAANRERNREINFRARFRGRLKQYGITADRLNLLAAAQLWACAICKRKDVELVIDHCHNSKVVRGLLCQCCNRALGVFKDDIKLLNRAIRYLRNPTNTKLRQ